MPSDVPALPQDSAGAVRIHQSTLSPASRGSSSGNAIVDSMVNPNTPYLGMSRRNRRGLAANRHPYAAEENVARPGQVPHESNAAPVSFDQLRPHAEGSPTGTFGLQSPAPIGRDPLARESETPRADNGAAVSCRRVPKRSSLGGWYMTAPTGSWSSLAIAAPASTTIKTTLKVSRPRRGVNGPARTAKSANSDGR
jgi:hypothetical protein